ncbi:sialin-like [Hetaerina americana]|uniref:sialin-like n=1 Tax=Hetaerina americana TaxID=62018 RepID=UPI003A7F19FE
MGDSSSVDLMTTSPKDVLGMSSPMAAAEKEVVQEISDYPRPKEWIQQRYIVAIMGALCIMMQYALKVNLSVAIVAMVKHPVSSHPNKTNSSSPELKENEEGEFTWSMEVQGYVLSSYYYGYLATQFLGGYAADRWGGKVVVGPGIALTGFFTIFSPLAARKGGPWAFFVVAVFLGTVIGMAASGPLSKWPLEGGGWPMVFYFFGTLAMVLILPWWLLVYDHPSCHPRISKAEKNYILKELRKEVKKRNALKDVPWMCILTDIHLWTGILFHWGTGWVVYTMLSDLPTYMKNVLNFDIQKLAFLSALPSLLSWIASIISGILSQWLRKKKYLSHIAAYKIFNGIAALGPTACLIAVIQVGYDPETIVILLALNGLFTGAFFGGSYVNHIDLAVNYVGITSGILHTVVNSAGIITPLVIAAIVKGNVRIYNIGYIREFLLLD